MKKIFNFLEEHEETIELVSTILSGIALLTCLILKWTHTDTVLINILPWVSIILCGIPIVKEALEGLIEEHDITADLLVALALVGSLILKDFFSAGEVAFIMGIGELLEELSSSKARKGIKKLVDLAPKKANLCIKNEIKEINIDEIKLDDILLIKTGDTVPVDGIVVEGSSLLDSSTLTGESMPLEKEVNDSVLSGQINTGDAFKIKVTNNVATSSLQRMIKLAEDANDEKGQIVTTIHKFASILVICALTIGLIAGTIFGIIEKDFWFGFKKFVTVIVVFCPCGFVLAVPTCIAAGIGNASLHGIIIKSGEALERIAECNIAVFDKTGTLTEGKPSVKNIVNESNLSNDEFMQILASGEAESTHPLAKAILKHNTKQILKVNSHETINGKGIKFTIKDKTYYAGNKKLLADLHIYTEDSNDTTIFLVQDGALLGHVTFVDSLKANVKETINELKKNNIKPVMMTGDNKATALLVARELGIDEYYAECSPEDKYNYIKSNENETNKIAMFGDGINDSLAIRSAYAGISFGNIGSDIAVQSSDAVLMAKDFSKIAYLFFIGKATKNRIKNVIILASIINLIAVVLAIIGVLDTVYGAIYHNLGSLSVILFSLSLLLKKKR